VLEGCNTDEQRSVVRISWVKALTANNILKEMCSVYCGNICSVKRFAIGLINSLEDIRKSQMMPRCPVRCGSG
jgi:hypothetical protein